MGSLKKQPPLWLANASVFLIMFIAVCAYFSWQIHLVKNSFSFHAKQHADLVSKIVGLNADATIKAERSIENLLQNLLENTARFVAYLDMVEPFNQDELTAFTKESGLAGISLREIDAPENWLPDDSPDDSKQNLTLSDKSFQSSGSTQSTQQAIKPSPLKTKAEEPIIESRRFTNCRLKGIKPYLKHISGHHLYVLVWSEPDYPDCIFIGIKDDKIDSIIESIGLNNVIKAISTVSGIKRVKAEGTNINVEIDQSQLTKSVKELTIHFYLFSFFLIMAGIILSFVLHRYQTNALNRVKEFERELAKERENAALGKSAAAIAHEIRNPLNSLSMGLQRLEIEKGCNSESHIKLVKQMFEAVKRANSSVTGLLNYAKQRTPKIKFFILKNLVEDIASLHKSKLLMQNINLNLNIGYHEEIESDPEFMGQVIENIIKNSIEAQVDGGFLNIEIKSGCDNNKYVYLIFKNSKCPIEPENADKIFEPYFTTRPEGTGLGMAIVKNIVKTLKGGIEIQISESRDIETILYIPKQFSNYDDRIKRNF